MTRLLKAIVLGLATALLGVLLSFSPYGTGIERGLGLPWLFGIRGPVPSPAHVAVIGINSETGAELNLPSLPRDWPRGIHATLIERLVALNAAVIVFDIFFSQEKETEEDAKLVAAVSAAKRVILFERLTGKTAPVVDVDGNQVGEIWSETLVPPFDALASAATALGVFPLPKIDAAVHEFWTFKDSVSYEPSMPAAAMQLFVQRLQPDWSEAMRLRLRKDTGNPDTLGAQMRALRNLYLQSPKAAHHDGGGSAFIAALEALYSGDEHRYLNFYGPPGTIRNLSYQEVVNSPESIGRTLQDTVVFVGYSDLYDPGQPDRFYTVYTRDDGVDLAGVEIAATAFANLLHDEALKPLSTAFTLVVLTTVSLLFAIAAYMLPAALGVVVSLVLWIGYAALAQWQFGQSHWLPLAVPLLVQAPLAVFLGVFGQYRFERQRGQRISEAINYYLPEHIAKEFAAGRIDPDSANDVSYGTCLATDMAGFSTIAQDMNPRELAVLLNEYFEVLANALNAHKVDVTEFRADAIMCAWLGDESGETPRRRAIQAALEARRVIAGFGKQYGASIAGLRVGLESGWFYVGHAGGGGHFVYSIVGDCANTASRLEGLNKYLGTQIIASAEVVNDLDGFLCRPLGLFQLKGKDKATDVYEILGELGEDAGETDWLPTFGAALTAFQENRLETARDAFKAVLSVRPDDGPSRFFLDQCGQLLQEDAPVESMSVPRIISMDSK
ncbi:adenylate/guanylate cyclase domain-containing protein [Seongchinamella unica]|uniref:Adenylate/guanylate cyclase domain-containing protein n=1 Tax=Seongchinamella unica TaxID=2547392 RepID=A0A4R5LPI2_9GAMM|nr:adenylate/guanylate cyclase domain-containing protein [Seongchinamella unica]TDG12418.1 adenylate/guanylate cyclase domain-containing protein [Seongchinamella unica]